ncbi:MAG: hypothetical protein HQK88_06195 [Nitrospirae bacterium]|nr:hypothetical protein [Nitrospirota bacterium]MBF0534716.1 hypothetical protein [Nitrospirota bacterium]MBF0616390.1 hypothetical protein [Nitrospirota bacterium]
MEITLNLQLPFFANFITTTIWGTITSILPVFSNFVTIILWGAVMGILPVFFSPVLPPTTNNLKFI